MQTFNDKEQQIKVSAFCLAYNHEKYIRDALEGFVNQKTDFKYEVIVHDDASSDNTSNIIKEYAKKYPDIIKPIFQSVNQYSKLGTDIIKEIILPKMKGQYIAICEGDDYWCDKNKLQVQADFLDSHLDYAACAHETTVLYLQDGKEELRNGLPYEYDVSVEETLIRLEEGKREPWQFSGFMLRREWMLNQPEFINKLKLAGDTSLDLYILADGKVRFVPRVMSVYRVGSESSKYRVLLPSHRDMPRQQLEMLEGFDKYTKHKYAFFVRRLTRKIRYQVLEAECKYNELVQGDMREIFLAHSFNYRIKMYIIIYLKPIYNIYRFLRNR